MASGELEGLLRRVNALEYHRDEQAGVIKLLTNDLDIQRVSLQELKDTFDNGSPEPARV